MANLIPQGGVFAGLDRLNQALDQRAQNAMALSQMQENQRRNALVEGYAAEDRARQLQEIQRQEMIRNAMSQPYTQQTGGPLLSQMGQDYQPVSLETMQPNREMVGQRLQGLGEWEQALKLMPESAKPSYQTVNDVLGRVEGDRFIPLQGTPSKEVDPYKGLSTDYATFLRATGAPNNAQSYKMFQDDVIRQKKAGATNVTTNVNGPSTPGQKKTDEIFAQEYNDFVSAGGYADVEKNIEQLREVATALGTKKTLTGPIVGNTPDFLLNVINPQSMASRDAVEEVVQRNLRLVLGAQFTQKEGDRLIARAYNTRLEEPENKKRVERLIKQIETAAIAKADAAKYFEEHGTLTGWKGRVYTSKDFLNDSVPTNTNEKETGIKFLGFE